MTHHPNDYDDLARRLEEILPPGAAQPPAGDADPRVDAALRLANAPHPQMPPEMLARIQTRVLTEASAHFSAQPKASRPSIRRFPSLSQWMAAAAVIAVLLFGGLIPAAASSLPGDVLYPVKQTLEQLELTLAAAPQDKALVYLAQAQRRADEAYALLAGDIFEQSLITSALDGLQRAAALARENSTVLPEMQTQTVIVDMKLGDLLRQVAQRQLAAPQTLNALTAAVQEARENGSLLLPVTPAPLPPMQPPTEDPASQNGPAEAEMPTPTATLTETPTESPSPTETATETPTATTTPTETATETPTVTRTPTATATPSASPSPTETPLLPVLPVEEERAVLGGAPRINVRSGPGITFDIIAVLNAGTDVTIIGQTPDGSWKQVIIPDGRRGWIADQLVIVDTPTPISENPELSDSLPQGGSPDTPAENQGGGAGGGSGNGSPGGDFGCEHPGNFCNAPGQGQGQGGGRP